MKNLANFILDSISKARTEFPTIQFSGFHNLWQAAREIKILGALAPQDRNVYRDTLKIIQAIDIPFICEATPVDFQQVQFQSQFSLVQQAVEFYNQGLVLVCDDQSLWEQIRQTVAHHQTAIAADFIEKLYTYTVKKKLLNAFEVLRHPHLANFNNDFQNIALQWEHALRKNQQQSIDCELLNHPLCHQLLNGTFEEILKNTPGIIQQESLLLYVSLLDGSNHCLEWFKGAVSLGTCPPQICLGLHEALAFEPEQVIFCLKHNQFRPLKSQLLLKNQKNIALQELLFEWKAEKNINVLAHTQETIFQHPLVQSHRLEQCCVQKIAMVSNRPIATPAVSSRPTTISATGFNQLMQDPYGFYARYILKLRYLERTNAQAFAKEFGLTAHKLIEVYLKQGLDHAVQYLHTLKLSGHSILWKGRMTRILHWMHGQVNDLRPAKIQSEIDFQTTIGPITLKARVDACLFTTQANLVVNFKTGMPPSKTDVMNGYMPQLAIELFLVNKLYDNVSAQAEFWQLKGTQPAGATSSAIAIPLMTLQSELEKITRHYLTKNTPFLTCPWPSKTPKYNDYKYIERLT